MNQLLSEKAPPEVAEDGFALPVDGLASPNADYFSFTGHRRLALEMLIESVAAIKKNPDSEESQFERRWLLGVESDCPISAPMCFEAVAGCGIDFNDVSNNFQAALQRSPETLLNALTTVRGKINAGDFDITEPCLVDTPDFSLSIPFEYRQRSAG